MKPRGDSLICWSFTALLVGLATTSCLNLKGHDRKHDTDTDDQPPAACAEVSCWEPPANTCSEESDAVDIHAPSGYCSSGQCFYAAGQVPCHEGLCEGGVCVETPCQGVTCVNPPEAECTEADRKNYAPTGYCTGGDCKYASKTSTCEAQCESGACVDDPCAEVFCRKPPAPYCEDDSNLVVFPPEGRCTVAEGRPECVYDAQSHPCQKGCRDGRCLDDPCAGVVCDYPPARHCDGAVLVVFEPHGVCDEKGMCSYKEYRRPCVEPCVDAHCGEDDACAEVTCDKPSANYCIDDSVLRVYHREGSCDEGFCTYDYKDTPCGGKGCKDGHCVEDPCVGVECTQPPAAKCEGDVLVDFEQTGSCNEKGVCSYAELPSSCPYGCKNGACLTGNDTDTDSASETNTETDTNADTSADTDTDKDTGTETDGGTVESCSGQPDFTFCEVVTAPDRAYDICVGEVCVSPGCGNKSCNVPGPHFHLADTSQRACYDETTVLTCPSAGQDFYGQDAQYGWDTTHDASERYTRNTPVTDQPIVKDNVTGLVWQGCAGGLSGSSCSAGSASARIWSGAVVYCDSLTWGGYTDWRLPDPYELSSIVDGGKANPAVDATAFPATSGSFWSSSSYAVDKIDAWYVNFDVGYLLPGVKDADNARVRCVRSGSFENRTLEALNLSGDRVVRDNVNTLEWQGCTAGLSGDDCAVGAIETYTWKNALAYCEGLSYGGSTDWRLPSRVELQSLMDQRFIMAIDPAMFPGTPSTPFLTSSTYLGDSTKAWSVIWSTVATVLFQGKNTANRVRCVRSGP